MSNFILFLQQHWILAALFIIILLAITVVEMRSQTVGPKRLIPVMAVELINHQNAIVVDIRSKDLFVKGHIIHSLNIPISELVNSKKKLAGKKSKPIILIGNTDQEALKVAGELSKEGFTEVKILAGGVRAWQNANLPLEK